MADLMSPLALDPKLTAAGLGQTASILLWTLLATFVSAVAGMPAETLAVVVGATGLLLSLPFGYVVRNDASPPPVEGTRAARRRARRDKPPS